METLNVINKVKYLTMVMLLSLPMMANASLIGTTIDIVADGTAFNNIAVSEGAIFNTTVGDQTLNVSYSEAGASPFFAINLFNFTSPFNVGGFTLDFLGLDWLGQPGMITSAMTDPSRAIAQAQIDFDIAVCGGNPFCIAQVQSDLNNAIARANLLHVGDVGFTDNSISFDIPLHAVRGAFIDLAFTAEHNTDIPVPTTLPLLLIGVLGLLGMHRRSKEA